MTEVRERTKFDQRIIGVLHEAGNLYIDRSKTRDVTMSMADKMAFGAQSFVTFIYHKACRMTQLCQSHRTRRALMEEAIDVIVYCAALIAWMRMNELGEEVDECCSL